jgi:plastocyanin
MTVAALLATTMFLNQECQSQPAPSTTVPAPAAQAPTAAPAAAPAAASGVKVVVKFTGTAPAMPKLKREADPFCAKTSMNDQEVAVNPNGTLRNVAVRVSQGAAPAATPPAEPKEIDQSNCMYSPRVVAGVTGQKLLIKNGDPIMHNVHTYMGTTTGFNQAQMKGSKAIEKTIAAGVTKFKCDVHPWMTGYVVGNDNPYVCVTDDKGECTLANLPSGAYTLEAWHEKYGTKTAQIAAGATTAEFSYAAQ